MREYLKIITEDDLRSQNSSAGLPSGKKEVDLTSLIGLLEGEILALLEKEGALKFRSVLKTLRRPTHLTTMAAGALIRSGLIRAVEKADGILLCEIRAERGEGARQ